MSDPATFQRAFGAALADGEMSAWNDRALERALRIHRNTACKAAQDALADNYPVVRALTGASPFAACAAAFVQSRPPANSRLCVYGDGFDVFLAAYAPFAELTYLRDVAWLERLVVESLFAADAVALDGKAMAGGLDLERALPLHPATRFGGFDSPVVDIWRAHQEDANADSLDALDWRPGAALVTRPSGAVQVTAIERPALAFLQACAAGRPLGEAALAAAAGDLPTLFSTLIAAGAFAGRAA